MKKHSTMGPRSARRAAWLWLVPLGVAACTDGTASAVHEGYTSPLQAVAGGSALPYPTRSPYRIKGVSPDGWDKDTVASVNTGGVVVNVQWKMWEPRVHDVAQGGPCIPGETEFEGRCYVVDPNIDAEIAGWTTRGIVVTGILLDPPPWAWQAGCDAGGAVCAPNLPTDFGRFAAMLAARYSGHNPSHGRIADFVIMNEVNMAGPFFAGCGTGNGLRCDVDLWARAYAATYAAAYDGIVRSQPTAKVLASLAYFFGPESDVLDGNQPVVSAMTFLPRFASYVGARAWRVAYHPYPPVLIRPPFSADDYPLATYGTIGRLAGWLRKTFPDTPSAAELQLTESGVNGLAPHATLEDQDKYLCRSFRNVLGTPGIESYIYHRMKDHPAETVNGLGVGLFDESGVARPAWSTWSMVNRDDLTPRRLSCGFEHLPFIRLVRSNHPTRGHWASSRIAPPGFTCEGSVRLLREPVAGTHMLYECEVGQHNWLSADAACEGASPLGPVGYAADTQLPGTIPIFRCVVGGDHFISPDEGCEGTQNWGRLGFVLPPDGPGCLADDAP